MVAQVDFTNWYWVHEEEREDTPDPDDPDAEQAYLDELDEHWWHRVSLLLPASARTYSHAARRGA